MQIYIIQIMRVRGLRKAHNKKSIIYLIEFRKQVY